MEFLVVLTDCMMPGMNGLELTEQIIAQDPEQAVVMITAFSSVENAIRFMKAGGTDYITKPFRNEELNAAIRQAVTGQSLQAIRNRLGVLSENIGSLLMLMREVAAQLHTILAKVNNPNDISHSLLRHKAKQLVNDFVRTIVPGQDFLTSLATLKTQLACVQRLSNIVGRVQVGDIESYLDKYIGDLQELHPGVKFKLFSKPNTTRTITISSGTEVVLITCELIDNALHALSYAGEIEITISTLKATGVVRITVHDNGPGVPRDIEDKIFDAGISTKGQGRGLGLCLVREAVQMRKGDIKYQNREGAEFHVLLPI
jgi:signal transduction histidine kinase